MSKLKVAIYSLCFLASRTTYSATTRPVATKQRQERLSELAILATEAKETEQMDIKELIRQFADLK
ncbi:hypothetical protein FWK35_00037189, partial [Aphis craccivora]